MRSVIGLWRIVRALVHAMHGAAIVAWRFPRLDVDGRRAKIQWWSAKLLRLLGLQLSVEGAPARGGVLIVANHISWLDIAAIHASAPQARFVSKADVLHWPVLGSMVHGAGTLFIERERKRDALRVAHQMAEAMAAGDAVAVFPEGTTSDGRGVLPFHANLLQSAIAIGAPVQPVVLRYREPGQVVSAAVEFVGETTMLQSAWRIVRSRGLTVSLTWLPPQASEHAERRALACGLRERVLAVLS